MVCWWGRSQGMERGTCQDCTINNVGNWTDKRRVLVAVNVIFCLKVNLDVINCHNSHSHAAVCVLCFSFAFSRLCHFFALFWWADQLAYFFYLYRLVLNTLLNCCGVKGWGTGVEPTTILSLPKEKSVECMVDSILWYEIWICNTIKTIIQPSINTFHFLFELLQLSLSIPLIYVVCSG